MAGAVLCAAIRCGAPAQPDREFSALDLAAITAAVRGLPAEVASRSVFVLGGIGPGAALLTQVDLYDPAVGGWTAAISQAPTARYGFRAVALRNRIYVIGGVVDTGETTTIVESYDPVANSWRSEAPMPQRLTGFVADVVGNSIVLLGGTTTTDMTTGTLTNQVYRYTPGSSGGSWTTITSGTSIPANVDMAGCSIDGGLFFGLGRLYSSGGPQSALDAYLLSANSTTAITEAAFSTARFGAAAACYAPGSSDPAFTSSRIVFAAGGSVQPSTAIPAPSFTPSATVDYYITGATNTMNQTAVLPFALYASAAAISYGEGRLMVIGGATAPNAPTTAMYSMSVASPGSDGWRVDHPPMPIPRYHHAAVALRP